MRSVHVYVGSLNPTKVESARVVFQQLSAQATVEGIIVPSGVSDQPIGPEETVQGAINRARSAWQRCAEDFPGAQCYGVGLEGGVDFDPDDTAWLTGWAVIVQAGHLLLKTAGPRLWLPAEVGRRVRNGEELGPVVDDITGLHESKTGIGAIGWLTGGLIPRQMSWTLTLASCAAPLFHRALYGLPVD